MTPIAAGFACGILLTSAIDLVLSHLLLVAASFFFLSILGLRKSVHRTSTVLVIVAAFFLGACFALVEKRVSPTRIKSLLNNGTAVSGEPIELVGVIDDAPESSPEGLHFTLNVESIRTSSYPQNASGLVSLFLPSSGASAPEFDPGLHYGDRLRVITTFKRTDSFRNPGVSSFAEYLERRGYDATGVIRHRSLIERLDETDVMLPLAWLYSWRSKVERQINLNFSPETAGILNAALLGNRYGLSRGAAERFRAGGTFHVLVISGLHISFIGGLVLLIARRLTRNTIWQFVSSTAFLWSYTLAVGAGVSVVRAAFMFTFVAFAPLVARRAGSINALAASALVLLALHPRELFDPSFQLTFLSVAAIVVFSWPLLERIRSIGSWTPSRSTPYPPAISPFFRSIAEILFWDERNWQQQLLETNLNYKLFKSRFAITLQRYRLQPILRASFAAVVVSLSVQIVLMPLLVIYFHRLSFAAIHLNIGVSLLMAIVSMAALLALLLAQISTAAAAPLIHFSNILNWLMVHSVDPFVALGVASVRLPEYSGARAMIYGVYYVPLLILAGYLLRWAPLALPTNAFGSRRLRSVHLIAAAQALLVLLIVFHPLSATHDHGRLRVDFLDVGQGDSALVTFPDGTTLLIDGGGRPLFPRSKANDQDEDVFEPDSRSIGDAVVSEFLWHRGVDKIDYLLATHADADHIDGLNDIAKNFYVRAAIVARRPAVDPEYEKFAQTMKTQNVPIEPIGIGDTLRFGEATATVLWPLPTSDEQALSGNNDSIVLRLQFGKRVFLLTGDMERAAELSLLQAGEDLRADVVKVAHHGSKTSSIAQLVDAVHAKIAVISVGQTSMFGHPDKTVVERWKASGAEVLTTGNCGTVTVSTNGSDLTLATLVAR